MPTFRKKFTLAASGVNNNIMSGSIYEFMKRPTRVVVAASSYDDDTGIGVNFGARTMAQSSDTVCPKETAAGIGPVVPDDVIVDDLADANERLQISLSDNGAGGDVRVLVQMTEIA